MNSELHRELLWCQRFCCSDCWSSCCSGRLLQLEFGALDLHALILDESADKLVLVVLLAVRLLGFLFLLVRVVQFLKAWPLNACSRIGAIASANLN